MKSEFGTGRFEDICHDFGIDAIVVSDHQRVLEHADLEGGHSLSLRRADFVDLVSC